jgi:hypothetical protein
VLRVVVTPFEFVALAAAPRLVFTAAAEPALLLQTTLPYEFV